MKRNPFTIWKNTDKSNPNLSNIKKEKKSKTMGDLAHSAHENAKFFGLATLPIITKLGIDILCEPEHHGDYSFSLKPLGLPITVGGLVLDVMKAPVCAAIASEEAVRAGITKLAALVFEQDPDEAILERLFKSFLIRFRETASLLIALRLVDENILEEKLKSGDIEDLVGLTLLNTAYCSRNNSLGLFLASDKLLTKNDCPEIGLPLFRKIEALKDAINQALNLRNGRRFENTEEREIEDARRACEWIELIVKGKIIAASDKPDKSKAEIDLINKVISLVDNLKLEGLTLLPIESVEVAKTSEIHGWLQKGSKGFKPTHVPTKDSAAHDYPDMDELKFDSIRNMYYHGDPLPSQPFASPSQPDEENQTRVVFKLGR